MRYLDTITKESIGLQFALDPTQQCEAYRAEYDIRKKCRDAVAGSKAIKDAGQKYLPMPNGQNAEEYASYKQRAIWTNFTARTVEAYIGMIYRKDPIRDYKEDGVVKSTLKPKYDPFFHVATFDGLTAEQFSNTITEEVITTNKVGVLLDYDNLLDSNGDPIINTKLDLERSGIKPLFSIYTFETIINWWTIYENTRPIPVLFVLKESDDLVGTNSLVAEKEDRYRILYLENYTDGIKENRAYKQILIGPNKSKEKKAGDSDWLILDVFYPMKDGKNLDYIPFYVLTDQGIQYTNPKDPLINDLVDVNLGHYINSADLENSLHWTGIKTAIFPGWNEALNGPPHLGKAMSVPPSADSKPFMLESASDSGIAEEMVKKEARMAVLGAEKISQTGRYIASATTAQISSISESSVLSDMSKSLSEALSRLFTLQLEWYGISNIEVSYELVTDYYADTLTGEELLQYVEAVQKGGISFEVMFHNLRKKEAYPSGWTLEQEREAIQNSSAMLLKGESMLGTVSDILTKRKQANASMPQTTTVGGTTNANNDRSGQ